MDRLYIGILTGTSADAINAAAYSFDQEPRTLATHTGEIPDALRKIILANRDRPMLADQFARISAELGFCFSRTINELINQASLPRSRIQAVGTHGQTILHRPDEKPPITLQAVDANIICAETGLTIIDDFRRADMAAGGQGAPLSSAFHQFAFSHPGKHRVIVNIGGIANLTVLHQETAVAGFDCGPGNTLLDYWTQISLGCRYDNKGEWAATARYDDTLLNSLCTHEFLKKRPPKSACTSDFSGEWLGEQLSHCKLDAATVQASFTELTAVCIAEAIRAYAPATEEVFLCGGGAHNQFLVERIRHRLTPLPIAATDKLGVHSDWVETALFAWLAKQRIERKPLSLKAITGAEKDVIAGAVYIPSLLDGQTSNAGLSRK